jgi:hypothetical protein
MTQTDKFFIETQTKLNTEDKTEVLKTLKALKMSGKASIIPLIIQLLKQHKDDEIGKEALSILGQLKDNDAIPYIIHELKSPDSVSFKKELLMSCWQSGLDYSVYLLDFTNEFIKGDFTTAIEAFTVIEEWIHNSPKEANAKCKAHLIQNIDKISEDKKDLYHELVKFIEGYI